VHDFILGFLAFLVGLAIGGGIIWVIANSRTKNAEEYIEELREDLADKIARLDETQRQLGQSNDEFKNQGIELTKWQNYWTRAKTQLEEKERNVQEQKKLLEDAKAQLSNTFKALAAQALETNNKGFVLLAEEKFKAFKADNTAEIDARKVAIESLVKPVSESLAKYQQETTELEQRRQKEMGSIGEQLRTVASTHALLHSETSKLVNALKSPQIRGRWGEITLRRTAELAGMSPHCDFSEQVSVSTEDGALRPDMLVRLPAFRVVVVDSKVPLAGFLEALEAQTDDQRSEALLKHARHVTSHVDKLSSKEYWRQFEKSPEFVVLFIPNDSFLAAAAEKNPDLVEYALSKKIVLATPTTFIALLRAIEFGWQQENAVKNAMYITNLGQELTDRFSTLVEHLTGIGSSLGNAVKYFNKAIATYESRILPTARKFKDLGVVGRKEIEVMKPVEEKPREVALPDGEE
jgi:DNA recombination protein RmuC